MAVKFKYLITLPARCKYDAHRWCTSQFGVMWRPVSNPDGLWKVTWSETQHDHNEWHFKNEKDAMMFTLRWGS